MIAALSRGILAAENMSKGHALFYYAGTMMSVPSVPGRVPSKLQPGTEGRCGGDVPPR